METETGTGVEASLPMSLPSRIARGIVLGNLLVAAVLVAATLINLNSSREEELARVRETADNLANGLSIELAAEIRLVDNALTTVTRRYATAPDAAARERQLIASVQEQRQLLPFADAVRTSDARGRVSVGLSPGEEPFAIDDREYFQQARDGSVTVISEPIYSRAFKDWCVIVARPLRTDGGEFHGLVYAVLASKHFHALFARLTLGADGAIALRSDSLRLVARYAASAPASSQGLGSIDVSPLMRQQLAINADHGSYITDAPLDGVQRMTAYRRVPGYPLTVIAGLSTKTYLARWQASEKRQWVFTAAVIALVASGFAYVYLQHRRQFAVSAYATRMAREQALVLDSDLVGMMRVRDRRIIWANRAVGRILGHETMVGASTRVIYADEATFEMVGQLGYGALRSGRRFRTQLKLRKKDGGDVWVDLSGASLSASESIWMIVDIDQLKNSEERAQYMALHDSLTGLANRRLFEELLRHGLAEARRRKDGLGVCYMDLDGFKPVIDTHGHEAGDEVLREVGERLRHELRFNDSVARLGGDEFAWLFSGVHGEADARHALERCLLAIQRPIALSSGVSVQISASIGLALSTIHGRSAEDLLQVADEAMYKAKRAGKGRAEVTVVDA